MIWSGLPMIKRGKQAVPREINSYRPVRPGRESTLRTQRDHNALGQGVMLQGLETMFLPEAALLPSAEGNLVENDLCRIDPGVAGLNHFRRDALRRMEAE